MKIKSINKKTRRILLYSMIIPIKVFVIIFFIYEPPGITKTYVWKEILNKRENVLIVLEDSIITISHPVTITSKTDGHKSMIQDERKSFSNDTLKEKSSLDVTKKKIVSNSLVESLFKIQKHYKSFDKVSFKLASELTLDDMKSNHILYLGSNKSLVKFSPYTDGRLFDFNPVNKITTFYLQDSVFVLPKVELKNNKKIEFVCVLKFTTCYGKRALIFLSSKDAGTLATIEYFLNKSNLRNLGKRLNLTKLNNSFLMLFGVEVTNSKKIVPEYVDGYLLNTK